MNSRIVVLVVSAVLVVSVVAVSACQGSSPGAQTPAAPSAALLSGVAATNAGTMAPQAAADRARPYKATAMWAKKDIRWAGQPGVDKSTFDGRCSLPSDYVITATFEGHATHAGRIAGEASHCSQIEWTPQGPGGATYSDGRGVMTTANGSTIVLRYGNGTTGVNPATGEMWFKDNWTFIGGTGHFVGASGAGTEGGRFKDFNAVLSGTPIPMTMEGTITYDPSRK